MGVDEFLAGVSAMKPGDVEVRTEQEKKTEAQKETRQGSGESQKPGWVRRVVGFLPFQRHRKSQEPTAEDKRLLAIAAQEWGIPVLKVYERGGLNPRQGRKVVKRLESRGLLRVHTFSGKGRGGRVRVIEVTEKGWEILEAVGIQRQKPLIGGGWEHELAARLIGAEGRRRGFDLGYEVWLEDRRFDVVWSESTGRRTFYEVELSDLGHGCENLLKAMEIPGVSMFGNQLVLVVRDKKSAERAAKILAKRGCRTKGRDEVSIRCISDYFINI